MVETLRAWLRRQGAEYRSGADRPLAGYLTLMSIYASATAGGVVAARRGGRRAPLDMTPWQLAQLAVSTFAISRTIAKDPVTSPLRAPFTRFRGASAPGELAEDVRGEGLRHSFGELITCPMCLGQWVATGLYFGLIFAPIPTRVALSTFTAVAASDALQHAYVALQQATEED